MTDVAIGFCIGYGTASVIYMLCMHYNRSRGYDCARRSR